GQSTEVDVPPDIIIDVVDEDDDITDDEDALPHDLYIIFSLMLSDNEDLINVDDDGVDKHLQKAYNTNKAAFKAQHWVIDPTIGTYNVEKIRRERLENITDSEWDKHNISKPLPLGGPPSQVTIQSNFFFNKDLEYLRYGSKGSRPALSILKIKVAYYPDAGLEQMVPDQFWIYEECKYDIAVIAVKTHMQILSVVQIKVFSMYGYDYMKKIVLHRVDLNEHIITERDFKYLYPSNFEDLYLLNLQEDFQLGIESYQTQLNLTKLQWDTTGFKYKHDYTIIDSPRAVMFWDKYGVQMLMRFNEIHKFSDGTLQQIDKALDYRVKEFRINRMNPCLNTRFWTKKDVDQRKAFMFAIQRRLKTMRIFRNLESFVGGRVREGDYRILKRTE
nr:hypothetical protein [Tanacetum cinerariifolium]